MECLAATFHGGDGTDIPRILEYLEHAESLEINDAEQKLLWEARELLIEESFGIYTLSSPNIPYLAIVALIKSGRYNMLILLGYRSSQPGIKNVST